MSYTTYVDIRLGAARGDMKFRALRWGTYARRKVRQPNAHADTQTKMSTYVHKIYTAKQQLYDSPGRRARGRTMPPPPHGKGLVKLYDVFP